MPVKCSTGDMNVAVSTWSTGSGNDNGIIFASNNGPAPGPQLPTHHALTKCDDGNGHCMSSKTHICSKGSFYSSGCKSAASKDVGCCRGGTILPKVNPAIICLGVVRFLLL